MKFVLIFSLSLIFLVSCSSRYQEKESRLVDYTVGSFDSLSDDDYSRLLDDLNDMFDVVYHKAECILDSGVCKTELRTHLEYDSIYCRIRSKAMIIDSVLIDYIKSGSANPKFLREYNESTAKAVQRAKKVGLN